MLAQLPGVDQAVRAAENTGSWVVMLLVVVILGMCAAFGFGFRYILGRLANQDTYIQTTQATLLRETTTALNETAVALTTTASTNRHVAEVLQENISTVAQLIAVWRSKPCGLQETLPKEMN